MRISNILLAIKELGIRPILYNVVYRLGLLSGYYRLRTPPYRYADWFEKTQLGQKEADFISNLLTTAQPGTSERQRILDTADEITRGTIQLYGAIPITLQFKAKPAKIHWCNYETGRTKVEPIDIKDVWEPARFSWVFTLGQAYHLTHDEKYPMFFWEQLESFLEANPPNLGPHWMNGQEVALRLISFTFAWQVFQKSPQSTTIRETLLKTALASHAERIMITLSYSRSQRNNHILSEAAGLYTAGLVLQGIPEAVKWRQTGWNLFSQGLRDQISQDGSYIQQSVSYHRLMLHLAIWMQALSIIKGANDLPSDVRQKLVHATQWLDNLVFPKNGHTPNMGANDGANILPLGGVDVLDYRPVLRLAKAAFQSSSRSSLSRKRIHPQQVAVMQDGDQMACMRVARYQGRPSHADQLHLDLWWQGMNIALDPGSYRYNYPSPWNNTLAGTTFHNTIVVDNEDQMIRAGRFMWLRHANIHHLVLKQGLTGPIHSLSADHDGYRHRGVIHERSVISKPDGKPGWLVRDDLLPAGEMKVDEINAVRLAWLLPDWDWQLDQRVFQLHSPHGIISIDHTTTGVDENETTLNVFRAGVALTRSNETHPTWGWYSPTYGIKEPALALIFQSTGHFPIQITTNWRLPQ